MAENNILKIQQQINLGADVEQFSSQSAMILINGKPEQGTTEFPQSGFYINEEQSLDDSFTEQISQVYKHLNNLIIVANQHGTLINQIFKREKEQAKPNDILDGMREAAKMHEFKNSDFISHMSSAMENKENESTNSIVGNSIKGVKSTLQGLCFANENIFEKTENISVQIRDLNKKISSLEDKKCNKTEEIDSKRDLRKELTTIIENTSDRLNSKMESIDSDIDGKVNDTLEKLADIQKETLWKIKDCEQMLKTRPTESFVNTSCDQVKDICEQKIKDFEENMKSTLSSVSANVKTNVFRPTDDVIKQLKDKILDLENMFEADKVSKNDEIKQLISEKFDNNHMKFQDIENMIHSNQQRIEELLIMIKKVEKTTIKFEEYEESTTAKFDMVTRSMTQISEDLRGMKFYFGGNNGGGGGTDGRGPGGGRGKTRSRRSNNSSGGIGTRDGSFTQPDPLGMPAPTPASFGHEQEDMDGYVLEGSGGGGMSGAPAPESYPIMMGGRGGALGMTQEEKKLLRRCKDDIDNINKVLNQRKEKIEKIEEKIGSMDQALNMIRTEMNHMVEREQFDQEMEKKLNIDEYYEKINEKTLDEDAIKKLQINMNKITDKMSKLMTELKSKMKKVKRKTEKVETKVDSVVFDLGELKENPDFKRKNTDGDGGQKMEGGKTIKEEVEGLNRALKRMFHMIKQLRNDHLRAISTTRGLLCLSCGSKDVNFPPPQRYTKAPDGNYYQTDKVLSTSKINGNEYDYGKDVFTKEQLVKEEVLKRHIPVDMILGLDVDDMHMGSILPKNGYGRPKTSANYGRIRRPGSANVSKSGKYRKNLTKTTLQPIKVKNKSLIKTGEKEKNLRVSRSGRGISKNNLIKKDGEGK